MGRGKNVSSPVKRRILLDLENGSSYREAAAGNGVSKSAVSNLVKRLRTNGTTKNLKSSGRPRKTTQSEDSILLRLSREDPKKTAVDLNAEMDRLYNVKCHVSTTKRRLRSGGP